MKKFVMLAVCLVFILACMPAVTPQETAAAAFEAQGDKYFNLRNAIKNTVMAIANMNLSAENYLKAFNTGAPNSVRLYKYVMAQDFKYRFLTGTLQEKKNEYERLIRIYEPFKNKFSATREFNYSMAILWGRRGEITQDTFDASNQFIAENIKKYAEALYGIDKKFQEYAACKILGRLHYKVPNVPFMLTWPDKNKSKAYLMEMLAGSPGNSEGKMFLADTIWDTGDRKTAEEIYRQVINNPPRKNFWFYDVRTMKLCSVRMKQLQVRQYAEK